MRIFKKNQAEPKSPPKKEAPKKPKIVIVWSTEKGEEVYALYQVEWFIYGYGTAWFWSLTGTGNKAWANRNAKHFGIKVPDQSKKGKK